MNEDQIEQGLRDVLVAEPPLRVDPDRMVDVAVRNRRHRRTAIAAGVGLAVVAALAAGAVVFTIPGDPRPASPPRPTQQQEIEQEMARNVAHLRYVLPKLLPGAAKIRIDADATQLPNAPGQVYMTADIAFTDSAGFAEVTMQIGSAKTVAEVALSDDFCASSRGKRSTEGKPLRCDTTERPDHSVLHVFEAGDEVPDHQAPVAVNELNMSQQRPGIGQVIIVNHRYAIDGHLRRRYPLTEEQGIALATDPALIMHDAGQ